MKLLLVNHYAGSPRDGMEYRPFYLAREWVRAGHQVLIVAASYSHVRQRQPRMPAGGGEAEESLDGVAYRWLPTPAYVGNGVGRALNIGTFLRRLWGASARIVDDFRPDVVIASSTYPMDIWAARWMARRAGATLVYEVHDLWPLSPIELSGMSRWHPFAILCQRAENDAYRVADVVISLLPKAEAHMQAHGLDLRKLHVVPNGVSPDEWLSEAPLEPRLLAHLAELKSRGRVVVAYAGSQGPANALDVLLDAAALVRDAAVSFVLVGEGHESARLARRVQEEGLDNVCLFGPIPKVQMPALLGRIDIAYLGWLRMPIYRFGIAPNKLMDYMMAGRPILHSVEAANDPVAEAGCGLTVPAESAAAVADGVRRLTAMSAAERAALGRRGRAHVLANNTYPVLARRFLEAVTGPTRA